MGLILISDLICAMTFFLLLWIQIIKVFYFIKENIKNLCWHAPLLCKNVLNDIFLNMILRFCFCYFFVLKSLLEAAFLPPVSFFFYSYVIYIYLNINGLKLNRWNQMARLYPSFWNSLLKSFFLWIQLFHLHWILVVAYWKEGKKRAKVHI